MPVLHNWFNKGRDMYYPLCGMMHIKIFLVCWVGHDLATAGFLSRYLNGLFSSDQYGVKQSDMCGCVRERERERERKEGFVLFNDALNTFYFTVIWCRTYGKRPLR